MLKPYFKNGNNDPLPLHIRVERQVRFEEVDALGIVWHGRYPSYLEDARGALGQKYGINYLDFHRNGVVAPIKMMHIDYHQPLTYPDLFEIEGILHWSDAARLNFEYIIRNEKGDIMTTGYTVQMMLDLDKNLYMVLPAFYDDFCKRWKAGELK
ncbi:MAG: acyl-CoA thioesterase [Deltaproteobacteria bacterium]|nr:acyl-CoA thioesterase [Deltaproteobacteria bacterium]